MSLSNAREVERLFRRLHRETAAQYEEELERATDEAEKGKRQQRLQFERLRPLLRSAQSKRPDRKLIKRLEVTQRKELQEFLKMARSQLRKRATRATEEVKDLAHHPMMQI